MNKGSLTPRKKLQLCGLATCIHSAESAGGVCGEGV